MDHQPVNPPKCVCPAAGYCSQRGRNISEKEYLRCEELLKLSHRLRTRPKRIVARQFIGPPRPPGPKKPRPQGPPKPCGGCAKRKAAMNKIVPGSGDLVEKITTKTGIKDKWEKWQESKNTRE